MAKTPPRRLLMTLTLALLLMVVALPHNAFIGTGLASAQGDEEQTAPDVPDKLYLVAWKHEFHGTRHWSSVPVPGTLLERAETTWEDSVEHSGTATIRVSRSTGQQTIEEMTTTATYLATSTTSWWRNSPEHFCPPDWGKSRMSTERIELVDPNEHASSIQPDLIRLQFDGPDTIASYPVGTYFGSRRPGHDPRQWKRQRTYTSDVELCDGRTLERNETFEDSAQVTDPWLWQHPFHRVPDGTFGDLTKRADGAFEFHGAPPPLVRHCQPPCPEGVTLVTTMATKTHITVTPTAEPKLSVGNTTVKEADSGTTPAEFLISLSAPSTEPVTVDYSTADDTATAPADYESGSDTVTFEPGETTRTVSIPILGETEDEQEEVFAIKLSNPTNASIEEDEGRGVIQDNDVWAKIWLNAFIPRDIPGLTMTVPGGPYVGSTMINGPLPISDCFLTDQRQFANDPTVSHRVQSFLIVDPKKQRIVEQRHHSDESIEVDCEDGAVECTRMGHPHAEVSLEHAPGDKVYVGLRGEANNGCFRGSPDIDYNGILEVDERDGLGLVSVSFSGRVEKFPDFEMYASAFHGQRNQVVFLQPSSGRPRDLFGPPREFVWGKTVVSEG